MVSTFKAVCALGDFSNADNEIAAEEMGEVRGETTARGREPDLGSRARVGSRVDGMTVNLNIQLQLPSDATSNTYDRFFEAMRKHILTPAE